MSSRSIIPPKMRSIMHQDPFMRTCIYEYLGDGEKCQNQIMKHGGIIPEWEHAMTYAGQKIQKAWAIVPVCWYHHRGGGMRKDYHRLIAFLRASPDDLAQFPRLEWVPQVRYLISQYEDLNYDALAKKSSLLPGQEPEGNNSPLLLTMLRTLNCG